MQGLKSGNFSVRTGFAVPYQRSPQESLTGKTFPVYIAEQFVSAKITDLLKKNTQRRTFLKKTLAGESLLSPLMAIGTVYILEQ